MKGMIIFIMKGMVILTMKSMIILTMKGNENIYSGSVIIFTVRL